MKTKKLPSTPNKKLIKMSILKRSIGSPVDHDFTTDVTVIRHYYYYYYHHLLHGFANYA